MRRHRIDLPGIGVSGRLLALGCLLLALLPPPFPWTRSPVQVIALVDESLSMHVDQIEHGWQQMQALLAEAPAGSRLQLVRFAAKPAVESSLTKASSKLPIKLHRREPLDPGSTDVAAALELALRIASPDLPSVILMVSDLAATRGDTDAALRAAHNAGIPLYLLSLEAGESSQAPTLKEMQLPSWVNSGDEVPVVVSVNNPTGAPVVTELEVDGRMQGTQLLDAPAGASTIATFRFVAGNTGTNRVTVRVTAGNHRGNAGPEATRTGIVNVLGAAQVLYVAPGAVPGPVATSLQQGGWKVITISPSELAASASYLERAGTVILDNLAIGDMAESAWQALVEAVRVEGKGLLVLGGPRSFGAGAYRHSTLEGVLPVTAEAGRHQDKAAVMFLLDSSGSMGQSQAGPSRFALARRAVQSSVQMVLPDDYLGIITFTTEAVNRLPLAARHSARAVSAALQVAPGGGTRLGPALRLAAGELRVIDTPQRLIVLVTDGFAGDDDLPTIADSLNAAGITVIALAVGSDPNWETLKLLTAFNDGRVLPVSDDATLPRLMSSAIAERRAPAVAGATETLAAQALPFEMASGADWPALSAYMVSKARPEARVYLQSSQGDPLLATNRAGAGRVAALPAGLGGWASDWWRWPGFGPFLGNLVQWLEPALSTEGISMAIADEPGLLLFTIDIQSDGAWDSGQQPRLLVDDPFGFRSELIPILQAPGRYRASLGATQPGPYRARVLVGDRSLTQAVYRDHSKEFRDLPMVPLQRAKWLEQGRLKAWRGVDEVLESVPRYSAGLRRLLLVLALLSYLLVMTLERRLTDPMVLRVRAWFSR